jgi:hypothetical protein
LVIVSWYAGYFVDAVGMLMMQQVNHGVAPKYAGVLLLPGMLVMQHI